MKSIGNDIIALNAIDILRTQNPRFYSKIITSSEKDLYQDIVARAIPFEHYIWLLWSVKESAYKFLKRSDGGLIFSPTKIIIQNLNIPTKPLFALFENDQWEGNAACEGFYSGEVKYNSLSLHFRSIVNDDLIMSIVNDDAGFENIHFGIQQISDISQQNQSASVRNFLLNKLKSIFPGKHLKIEKSDIGYLIVAGDDKDLNILVSLAHHRQFTSYSFISPN